MASSKTTPPSQRILRVRRVDTKNSNDFCLLSCTQEGASHPLDLKIVGTEGSEAYVESFKHAALLKSKSTGFSGPVTAWEAILRCTITPVGLDPEDNLKERTGKFKEWFAEDDVEVVAKVHEGKGKGSSGRMEIVWRKGKGKDFTTLGSLSLPSSQDEEIELFDWLSASISSTSIITNSLTSTISARDSRIKVLEMQLGHLVQAKKQHENELLEKFCLLLNGKKSKIRELQRVIVEGAGPAEGSARDITAPTPSTNVSSKTAAKGKATAKQNTKSTTIVTRDSDSEDSDTDDSAFEAAPLRTPSHSGTDDEDEEQIPVTKVKGVIGGKTKGKIAAKKHSHIEVNDEEEEVEEAPKKKAVKGVIGKTKGKQPSKEKKIVRAKSVRTPAVEYDECSDGFEEEPPATRTRAHDQENDDDDTMDLDATTGGEATGKEMGARPEPWKPSEELPVRRELPVTRNGKDQSSEQGTKSLQPEPMDEDDDETDDEL